MTELRVKKSGPFEIHGIRDGTGPLSPLNNELTGPMLLGIMPKHRPVIVFRTIIVVSSSVFRRCPSYSDEDETRQDGAGHCHGNPPWDRDAGILIPSHQSPPCYALLPPFRHFSATGKVPFTSRRLLGDGTSPPVPESRDKP